MTTEINCRTDDYQHPTDPVFTRNHAPNRVVLGIIAKDGVLAQCVCIARKVHRQYCLAGRHAVPSGAHARRRTHLLIAASRQHDWLLR